MKRKPVLILQGGGDCAQSGCSYLASSLLWALLFLPTLATVPTCPHSHLHAVFFAISLPVHLADTSQLFRPQGSLPWPPELGHILLFTLCWHHVPTSTSQRPELSYIHFVIACTCWMPTSLTTPGRQLRLSSSLQPCTWHLSMHPTNGPLLGKSEKYLLICQGTLNIIF